MTGPNHELFVKVLAQIEREPQKWDQGEYRVVKPCGTAYCFAGWAVTISGERWRNEQEPYSYWLANGETAPAAAVRLLGVSLGPSDGEESLFAGENTLDDLYRISAELLGIDEQVLRDKVAAEVSA